MSTTLKEVGTEVRVRIFDPNTGRPVYSDEILYGTIDSSLRRVIAPKLSLGKTYLPDALSYDTTNNTYTLRANTVPEIRMVRQVHSKRLGRDIDIVPYERIASLYDQIRDPSKVTGYPLECALWQEPDGTLKIRLYPWPNLADTADIMWSLAPDRVLLETDDIMLNESGIGALVFDSASSLLASANSEKVNRLRIDKDSLVALYERKRDQCLRDARIQPATLRPVGSIRHVRKRGY